MFDCKSATSFMPKSICGSSYTKVQHFLLPDAHCVINAKTGTDTDAEADADADTGWY